METRSFEESLNSIRNKLGPGKEGIQNPPEPEFLKEGNTGLSEAEKNKLRIELESNIGYLKNLGINVVDINASRGDKQASEVAERVMQRNTEIRKLLGE